MNRRATLFIVLIISAITLNFSHAAPPSRSSLEALIEASGLNADLKEMEQSLVKQAVEEATKKNPQDETTKRLIDILLADNLRESFQYSLLLDEVTYFLKKQVSEEDVQMALTWYQSDLGQRIVQAETKASTARAEIQNGREELLKQQDLATMASELDQAIGLTDAMIELQINTQKTMILAGLAIIAPGKDLSDLEHANWSDIKASDRDALRKPIEQHIHTTFIYTMKDFSKEEREKYREFFLKPGSIKLNNAVMTGISKAVEIGAHNFMTELTNDIKNPSPELDQLIKQNTHDADANANASVTETTPDVSSDW
jgi:hypothetical protein